MIYRTAGFQPSPGFADRPGRKAKLYSLLQTLSPG